jgi:CRISPR-associated protein Cst1
MRIDLTGNPFVDTGLAVIAARLHLDDVCDLTVDAVRALHEDGRQLTSWNSSLKNFTMIFTSNSLLTNPSIKDKAKRAQSYQAILGGLLSKIGNDEISRRCEACGTSKSVDFDTLCRTALAGIQTKDQARSIGRDWFPLSGSLGSDAQALPAASRPVNLCAKCLFAIHYLPLGLILLDGRLAVFQSTSIEFWYELARDIVTEVQGRIGAGNYDSLGAKEGSKAVAKRLLGLFERLQSAQRFRDIPPGTALQVWRFTNSGASPECEIEEIPNPALVFLWEAVRYGLRQEIEKLIDSEGKKDRTLFRCITERQDYFRLYPKGKWTGASPRLFALYQSHVCGRSGKALALAHTLAKECVRELRPKDLERMRREEAFKERSVRNQFRSLMAELAQKGKFSLNDYLGLFPLRDDVPGIQVHGDGWRLVRYYLHHVDDSNVEITCSASSEGCPPKLALLRFYGTRILQHYVQERGKDRFQSEVLNRMGRGEIGALWLRRQFTSLAEAYPGFSYGMWEHLCRNEKGDLILHELLFQMRILWSELLTQALSSGITLQDFECDSGLTTAVETHLREIFARYTEQRGLNRFHRDVLARLRRKEIGLGWFKHRITNTDWKPSQPALFSWDEWESFVRDENGRPLARERLFQMHLLFSNLYRESTVDYKTQEESS